MKKITFLIWGWTIDKDYWVGKGMYDVEIWNPTINKIVEKFDINSEIEIVEVIRKDSLDMTNDDRKLVKEKLKNISNDKIIITHWADTMIDTWKVIQDIENKIVILVGSARPWAMNNSDAELNIWYALWILAILADEKKYWVYLAMNWEYFNLNNVEKWDDGVFRKIK